MSAAFEEETNRAEGRRITTDTESVKPWQLGSGISLSEDVHQGNKVHLHRLRPPCYTLTSCYRSLRYVTGERRTKLLDEASSQLTCPQIMMNNITSSHPACSQS
ncbi:unnamed protein product [Pleuronectes platessa]|uniref:Uncharacterized protein n=1 Tax=Pleuronectes platessa TaxID=8262 RepID=A0A9N7V073_PLEPL|nr:unnamed protein product [Pleuronectes platessa]